MISIASARLSLHICRLLCPRTGTQRAGSIFPIWQFRRPSLTQPESVCHRLHSGPQKASFPSGLQSFPPRIYASKCHAVPLLLDSVMLALLAQKLCPEAMDATVSVQMTLTWPFIT